MVSIRWCIYTSLIRLLETINGWHSPSIANTDAAGGTMTIKVQSLHMEDFIDNATTSGDAFTVGGDCVGEIVEPFEICTYEIESSNGHEGTLILNAGLTVTIDPGRDEAPIEPGPDDGDCSSSLGLLSLPGLSGWGFSPPKQESNMIYLIWRREVLILIEERFDSAKGWDTWADWKEYFIRGDSPERALNRIEKVLF